MLYKYNFVLAGYYTPRALTNGSSLILYQVNILILGYTPAHTNARFHQQPFFLKYNTCSSLNQSMIGFAIYIKKNSILNTYKDECDIDNCYICLDRPL